jgi:branched-chain amino acid transport system substrate-binding protein
MPRRAVPVLAVVAIGLLMAGCGSRQNQRAIVAAAQQPIVVQTLQSNSPGAAAPNAGTSPDSAVAGPNSTTSTTLGATGSTAPVDASGSGQSPSGSPVTSNSTSGSSQATESTINLGNVGTYSGVAGAVFGGAEPALQVWEQYVNAHGGLNGHPVHIYFEDDGGDPSTSVSEVEQEVTQDHVIAFVGNFVPLTVSASEPYLAQQDIPVIGGDSDANEWWESPVLFPQGSSAYPPSAEADFSIQQAVARGYTKMAVLYCVEDPGCSTTVSPFVQQGTITEGATTVYSSSISLTQPDFTAQCIDAKNAGATFVYFAGDSDSLIRMSNDCVAQGYHPIYAVDSLAVTASLETDSNLNGLLAGQSNFPWIDSFTPAQAIYQQAMKTYDPSEPGSASTAAEWTAGELAVAADKYLTADPTSAEFFQGLWAIKNDNLGGLAPPLTFTQNEPATPSPCYWLMTIKNGAFVDVNNGSYQCNS